MGMRYNNCKQPSKNANRPANPLRRIRPEAGFAQACARRIASAGPAAIGLQGVSRLTTSIRYRNSSRASCSVETVWAISAFTKSRKRFRRR